MKEINTSEFESLISNDYSFVYITAVWCGPCKAFSPIVTEISEAYKEKMSFGKLDADQNSEKLTELGVKALPTIISYRNGSEVERASGLQSKQRLTYIIENTFSSVDNFDNDEEF